MLEERRHEDIRLAKLPLTRTNLELSTVVTALRLLLTCLDWCPETGVWQLDPRSYPPPYANLIEKEIKAAQQLLTRKRQSDRSVLITREEEPCKD